jgi:phosphoglycolate phosphatase
MPARKKFIVWDWNGTLLDDADAILIAVNAILAKFKRAPIAMEDMHAHMDRPFRKFYASIGFDEKELDRVMEIDSTTFHLHYEQHASTALVREGTRAVLQRLKTHKVQNLIVSNHITDKIMNALRKHEIHAYFDEVIAYACHKTQFKHVTKGEKLQRHIQDIGLNATNAIIIGDAIEEIEIARELGTISVAITGGECSESRLREKKPDHVIHSMHELNAILEERGFVA